MASVETSSVEVERDQLNDIFSLAYRPGIVRSQCLSNLVPATKPTPSADLQSLASSRKIEIVSGVVYRGRAPELPRLCIIV